MRRNIAIDYGKEGKIYFYTHWGAEKLEDLLAQSLERGRERWDDSPYLARIIFEDMIRDDIGELTGYGIAPFMMDDEYPTLVVDMQKQTVNDISFEDFIKNPSVFAIK